MKFFLRNTFFFLLPLLALLFLEAHAIFGAKENITLFDAIALQKKDTTLLVGYSLSYNEPQYKYILTTEKHPDILVLGTSRTMQIRKFFFDSAYSFYNAGGAVERINEYTNFLKSIHYNPKVLIIALDQYFFNRSWDDMSHNPKSYKYIPPSLTSLFLGNSQTIISDIFNRKIPLFFPDNNNVGLNGIVNGQGYRYDGSYDYNISGKRKEEQHDYLFSNTLERIKNGNQRFEYASDINKGAVSEVIELIKYCKEKNIHLIAFLPPYAPTIWAKMQSLGQNYAYMSEIFPAIYPYFEQAGFPLEDFSDAKLTMSKDEDFIDGFHGSDKVYFQIFKKISQKDSVAHNIFVAH